MPARLLMAAADDLQPELSEALGAEAGVGAAASPPRPIRWLADITADADRLERQRWAILAPEGPAGDQTLAALEPLRRLRSEEQGVEARVYRLPPNMSAADAEAWKAGPFLDSVGGIELERPRYLLLAGGPAELSLPLARVMSSDGIVGRLHFRDPDGYGQYVEKLRSPPQRRRPSALYHVVEDGTPATALGRDALVEPAAARAEAQATRVHGDVSRIYGGRAALLEAARAPASVLFSVAHGLGPPRRSRGWEAERWQGAVSFGPGETPLAGEELARTPFLPHGVWLLFACYGAGTPAHSRYAPWLRGLAERGLISPGVARDALRGVAEGPGFVAALPQALLANPQGPLAIVSHVDLAWSYSFEARLDGRTGDRSARFSEVIEELLRRRRVGAALLELSRWSAEVNRAITERMVQALSADDPSPTLADLWMLRQDLEGFTLLGDPAAQLPSDFEDEESLFANVGFGAKRPAPRFGGFGAAPPVDKEAAVLEVLRGASVAEVAARLGRAETELSRWVERYRDAGRRALADEP